MGAKAIQVESLWSGLLDDEGQPISSGRVYTYEAGTNNLSALFTDRDKTGNATNPIILDTFGRAEVYADGLYKFVVKDADDNTLYDMDYLEYIAREAGTLDSTIIGGTTPAAGTFTNLGFTNYLAYSNQTIDAGVAVRDVVYYTSTGWVTADANDIAQKLYGLYIGSNTVLIKGLVTGFAGLVADSKYFLQSDESISTTETRIFVGTAKSTTELFVDISFVAPQTASGNASAINSIEQMIRVEKNSRLQVEDSQKNIVQESFIQSATSRLVLDATLTHNQSTANCTLNTSQVEGYVYDTMIVTDAKTLESIYYSVGQNTNTFFDVSTGNSTTQTVLTSTTNRSSEFKSGDVVWFVPFRRLKATTTTTKWIQAPGAIRTTLIADGTGTTDITLNHNAIASTLPAYDDDQLKYVCFPEHVSIAYKQEASASTALTAYTKASPSGYTAVVPDAVTVKEFGIAYPSYVHSHWKLDESSGNAINSKQPSGTYNLTQVGTVPSAVGKFGLARGPFSASNYFYNANSLYNTSVSSFWFECWFKTSATGVNQFMASTQTGVTGWQLKIGTTNKIGVDLNGTSDYVLSSGTYADGNWHYVLFAMISTSGANNARLYIDGSLVSSNTGVAINNSAANFYLGIRTDLTGSNQGIIDSSAYANSAPSTTAEMDALVAQRYASGVGREYGSNLGQIFSSSVVGISANAGDRITFASGITRNAGLANTPSLEHYGYKL